MRRIAYENCPLCGHGEIPLLRSSSCDWHDRYQPQLPPIMTWLQCSSCKHVFTDGYFDDEALALVYSTTNEGQVPGSDGERARQMWAPTVRKVGSVIESGTWLDVGFGDGSLLFTAAEWGFDPVGIDARRDTADRMAALGITVLDGELANIDRGSGFDVVSFFDVLEHISFPTTALVHAHRLLRPGGCLVVSTPNMDTHAWRQLDEAGRNPYWGEIEHYHSFTRSRLVSLLSDHGFRFLSYDIAARWRLGMEILAIRE